MAGPTEIQPLNPSTGDTITSTALRTEPVPFENSIGNLQGLREQADASFSDTLNRVSQAQTQTALDKVVATAAQGTGVGHKILATLAALNGNFGPAMMIQEQERKTKAAKELTPAVVEFNRLMNSGKQDEALTFSQQVQASVGDRIPEAAKVFADMASKASQKQQQWQASDVLQQLLEQNIKDPEHPNYGLVKTWGKFNKMKTPIAQEGVQAIMSMLRLNSQNINGANYVTNVVTGQTQMQPLQEAETLDKIPQEVIMKVSYDTNLTPSQIVNLRNGKPTGVMENGQDISANPKNREAINTAIANAMGEQRSFERASKIPLDPASAEAYKYVGATNEQIEGRNVPPELIDKSIDYRTGKATRVTVGITENTPLISLPQQLIAMDRDTGQMIQSATHNDVKASGGRIVALLPDNFKLAQVLFQAKDKLEILRKMLPEFPDIDAPLDRIPAWIDNKLNNLLGYNAKLSGQKTVRTAISSVIEQVANNKGISASRYREMAAPAIGDEVTKQGGEAVINQLQEIINSDINRLTNQAAVPTIQSQLPRGTSGYDLRGKPEEAQVRQQSLAIAESAAREFNAPADLVKSIMRQESDHGTFTVHREGDGYGPMQITDNKPKGGTSTAEKAAALIKAPVEQVLSDPATNIRAGTALIADLYKKNNGDYWLTARDYNGSGAAADAYASRVTGLKGPSKKGAAAVLAPIVAPQVSTVPTTPALKGNFKGFAPDFSGAK